MLYSEFKEHLRVFLWRPNDTVLLNALDQLILMGMSELDRVLTIQRREAVQTIYADPSQYDLTYPADIKTIRSLSSSTCTYAQVTLAQLMKERINNPSNVERPFYSVSGGTLRFAHAEAATAGFGDGDTPHRMYTAICRMKLPTFAEGEDSSWVVDEYLDLATYTVLKHTAPWLREDERVTLWTGMAQAALSSVLEDDVFNVEWGGSPRAMSRPVR